MPFNYVEELQNFEEITTLNSQHYKNSMQKMCKSTIKDTEEMKSNGLDHMAIEEAIETLFDMSKNIGTIKEDVVQKSQSIEAALVELEKTKNATNLTAKAASEFTGNAAEKQRELAKLKKALVDRGDLASVKKQELQEELKKWREMLGLELINSTHGGIILVFTSIDREEPTKKYICELEVEGGKTYVVKNCNPAMEDVHVLVDVLNKTNDLSGFVVNLRKKFAAMKK